MTELALETHETNIVPQLETARVITKKDIREGIADLEAKLLARPDCTFEAEQLMHHFTDGIYARTVLMRAGEVVVGKIHKHEHLVIVSAGHARVVSEEFGAKDIIAPCIFKSPPGVKRALLILVDCVWTTIHKNSDNEQDVPTLEDRYVSSDYKFEGEE